MCRQPITIIENGKTVTHDGLYFYGTYLGVDKMGNEIGAEFHEGWYLKPKLKFTASNTGITKKDYDETTGERRSKYDVVKNTYEHYIFLPENKADRVKFLNDLMKNSPGTTPESVAYGGHLSFRQQHPDNSHSGAHGGNFNWSQFCELSLKELGEAQQKGYYKDEKTGQLKDKDGVRVKYEESTGKLEAIK